MPFLSVEAKESVDTCSPNISLPVEIKAPPAPFAHACLVAVIRYDTVTQETNTSQSPSNPQADARLSLYKVDGALKELAIPRLIQLEVDAIKPVQARTCSQPQVTVISLCDCRNGCWSAIFCFPVFMLKLIDFALDGYSGGVTAEYNTYNKNQYPYHLYQVAIKKSRPNRAAVTLRKQTRRGKCICHLFVVV